MNLVVKVGTARRVNRYKECQYAVVLDEKFDILSQLSALENSPFLEEITKKGYAHFLSQ